MADSEMKIKEAVKDLDKLCEKLTEKLCAHLDAGLDEADTMEVGAVVDMIKDLSEAKEKKVKALYYAQIMQAMEEGEEDEPKYYRGRSATTGRYVHRPYTRVLEDRDMDREYGRMYYSGEYTGTMPATLPSSQQTAKGYSEGYEDGSREAMRGAGRYDRSRRGYEETKRSHTGDSEMDREAKVKSLDGYLGTIEEDLRGLMPGMTMPEKTLLKNRLQSIQNIVV